MSESMISADQALTLVAGDLTFEFVFSTDHGPTHVKITHEGVVKIFHDHFGLLDSIIECMETNIGIKVQPGADFSGIVLRLDDRNCVVLIPPYGEGPVNPEEAKTAGWAVCQSVEVWVKAVLDAATFTLSAREVNAPESE